MASKKNQGQKGKMTVWMTDDDDVWICTGCKKNVKGPNHKLLECEYCDKHYCIECVEITDKEYKIMTDKLQIHWFCPPCDTKVMINLKNKKSCEESFKKFLKKVEESIIELEKEIRTKVDETRVIEMIKEAQLEKTQAKSSAQMK